MEEEELNKRLSARITEVFDNYEDTTADEGWALLRQKFPKEKKDRGLIWLWYGAAAVLLLGLGFWFMQGPPDVKKQVAVITKPAIKQQQPPAVNTATDSSVSATMPKPVVKTQPIYAGQQTGKPKVNSAAPTQQFIATAKNLTGVGVTRNGKAGTTNSSQPAATQQTQNIAVTPNVSVPVGVDNYANNRPSTTATAPITNAITAAGADSAAKQNEAIAQTNNKPVVTKPALTSAEALAKLFAETAGNSKETKQSAKKDKKPVLGVYAATYFNYANGSDNRVNVGAGISSDFSITRKLKLSTGLAIAQNSLNYDYSKNATNAYSNDVARASLNPTGTSINNSGLYNASGSLGYDGFLSPTSSTPQNYSANLIGLDLPVNLKYEFNPGKSETYVSAGLSSGTFINQTYTTEYAPGSRQTQPTTTQNNFGNFYLAKMLNVSFGMGYSVGKNNRLVVEPFLKYPLSGLGAQQIKFGAGGINLKLNFTTHKK